MHVSTCDTEDLTAALVSQSARAFGVALECLVALADIQSMNKSSVDKLAAVEEEIKKLRSEDEATRDEKIEDATKVDSALAEIEALKREVRNLGARLPI